MGCSISPEYVQPCDTTDLVVDVCSARACISACKLRRPKRAELSPVEDANNIDLALSQGRRKLLEILWDFVVIMDTVIFLYLETLR